MFEVRFADYPVVAYGLRDRLHDLCISSKNNSDWDEINDRYLSLSGFVDGLFACRVISSREADFLEDLAVQIVFGRLARIEHSLDRPF